VRRCPIPDGCASASELVDRLHANRERWGFSYVLTQDAVPAFAPLVADASGT
jgi:hypothetical protein